ncbi:MAG: GntR family transcriptional regulator [Butyricicoccaceae bacterium]
MEWKLTDDRPIYLQLVEHITQMIVSGEYAPASRLPSVRDLASDAGVNPNTMQRALSELERTGLLFSQRTAGRFITEDAELIAAVREQLAVGQIHQFFDSMNAIGYDKQQTIQLTQRIADREAEA